MVFVYLYCDFWFIMGYWYCGSEVPDGVLVLEEEEEEELVELVEVLVFVLFVVEEYIRFELESEFESELGASHLIFNVPVAASSPNTYNNIATITVININGMNTSIHDMIVIPP
jgi:hypothetical protein